jgi:UDP-arabinose 4-epimerase
LGDAKAVNKIFAENAFDAVMHFAAVAYVGESTMEPLRYTSKFESSISNIYLAKSTVCIRSLS